MIFANIEISSTIMIYAHQHFDNPIVDAMDYHWPIKVTKFAIKAKFSTFYTMEMLKMSERGSNYSPCNLDLKYSYSKGGVYKIIVIVNYSLDIMKIFELTHKRRRLSMPLIK